MCYALYVAFGTYVDGDPKPVKARRQARTALEWLHLPLEEVKSTHLTEFRKARLKQVKPATVNREMDLISAVIHKAINSWDHVITKNPMKGAKRPIYDNGRDRRLEGDEQERLFRSARRAFLTISTAALLGVFALVFRDYHIDHFIPAGIACLLTGLLLAIPAAFVSWLLLRRGFALNSVVAGLVGSALAGLCGVTMLELHCANFQALRGHSTLEKP